MDSLLSEIKSDIWQLIHGCKSDIKADQMTVSKEQIKKCSPCPWNSTWLCFGDLTTYSPSHSPILKLTLSFIITQIPKSHSTVLLKQKGSTGQLMSSENHLTINPGYSMMSKSNLLSFSVFQNNLPCLAKSIQQMHLTFTQMTESKVGVCLKIQSHRKNNHWKMGSLKTLTWQ
jgi:hypothetical protein